MKLDLNIEDQLFCDFIKTGSEESFKQLYRMVKPWLYRFIFKLIPDKDIVGDIQQETWIKLLQTQDRYNPERGKVTNLIYTIAKNEALKWNRNNARFIRRKDDDDDSKNVLTFGVDTNSPEKIQMFKEKCEAIRKAIDKLNVGYQNVILMYYFRDMDVKEIADELKKPIGTIKTWLDRARKKLGGILPEFLYKSGN